MRKQVLIATVALVVMVGIAVGWYVITQRQVGNRMTRGDRTSILLVGLEDSGEAPRADAVVVIHLGEENGVGLLSLPLDLRVRIDSHGFERLGSTYGIGGVDLVRETVSDLLGVELPFFVAITYGDLAGLIDALGGISVTVEEALQYDDAGATPPLHVDIQPGPQMMDGRTALAYVRFRSGGGEFGRISRQQKLLAAVLASGFPRGGAAALRAAMKSVHERVTTDLSQVDLVDLGNLLLGPGSEPPVVATIPGTPATIDGTNVLEPRAVEMSRIVARLFQGIDLLTPDRVTVAVFNGSGERLLAARIAAYLRVRGFRVTAVANADAFDYERTTIVCQCESEKTRLLQSILPEAGDVVSPDAFAERLTALRQLGDWDITEPEDVTGETWVRLLATTDLLLIGGPGFEAEDG